MGHKSNGSSRYSEEFKRDAVALVRSAGKTVTEVAREIGVSAESLRNGKLQTQSCVLRRGGVSQCSKDRAAPRSEWVPGSASSEFGSEVLAEIIRANCIVV